MRCCTSADNNSFLILYSCRFAVNLTYYGISMNVAKFSGNIFVNFAVSSTVETVACLFCMMGPKRFGRKKFLCISMLIGGSTCLCTIFTTLFSDECKYDTSWFNDSMLVVCHFQPSNSRVMSIILIGWWNRNSWKTH